MNQAPIYVQIPAYRDSELPRTLLDLYAKAEHPNRLRVGVVWQRAADEALPRSVTRLAGLEIVDVPCEQSRGCNWARSLLQKRWRGEPYTLFLDSHHRFVRRWDSIVVRMYESLRRRGVSRPIVTAYLPAYSPDGGTIRKRRPYKIYPLRREQGMLVRLTSYPIPMWRRLSRPVEAEFASLHFLFTAGSFNDEIRMDPDIYFFGDEVLIGLRAFTHGYDLFHPHVVLGWHCYDRASRVPHWDDHHDWHRRNQRSLHKLRRLFTGTYRGPFGLGRRRGVRAYEDRLLVKLVEA